MKKNMNEINEFCKKYEIDQSAVDWTSREIATEEIMDIFYDTVDIGDIDIFYDIIGYSFIVPEIVQECRDAYCRGRSDRRYEGFHYGLYSEDICCEDDDDYNDNRHEWYRLGYSDTSAYYEGLMDS